MTEINNEVVNFEDPTSEYFGYVPLFGSKGSYELIEKAGRTCYKSESSKVTKESAIKFIGNMWKSGHLSVLEHSCFVLRLNYHYDEDLDRLLRNQPFLKYHQTDEGEYPGWLQGSLRSWIEFTKTTYTGDIKQSIEHLYSNIDSIMNDYNISYDIMVDHTEIPECLKRVAFRFVTDRAVMAELTRHRKDIAFSVESQRYVDHLAGVVFIKPYWFDSATDLQQFTFTTSLKLSEIAYKNLREADITKQAARGVLPNATKTVIFMSADTSEMDHIYSLRCSKEAHPDISNMLTKAKFQQLGS